MLVLVIIRFPRDDWTKLDPAGGRFGFLVGMVAVNEVAMSTHFVGCQNMVKRTQEMTRRKEAQHGQSDCSEPLWGAEGSRVPCHAGPCSDFTAASKAPSRATGFILRNPADATTGYPHGPPLRPVSSSSRVPALMAPTR